MPPQHGKSMTTTETLPSYILGKFQEDRVVEVSYGDSLAQLFGRRNKQKIENFGEELFGIKISSKTRAETEFELDNGVGGMISRGIMGGLSGRPANWMIIDDPFKNRQEADSEVYRNRIWDEWLNVLKPRLAADASVILINTRWHEDDLAGRLLEQEKGQWTVLSLPCEAEENDPLGRRIGEALMPEIGKDDEWLKLTKQSYISEEGLRFWLALYQQRPTPAEGNIFKREWLGKFYRELPHDLDEEIQSWDCTFKDKKTSDYVAGGVWARRGAAIYLKDQVRDRMSFTGTLTAIRTMTAKHPDALAKYIEAKANGDAVIDTLYDEIPGIIEVEPEGGKVARAEAVTPLFEAGNVYLPHPDIAPWIHDYIEELVTFPNGKNDDQVDQTTQALVKLKRRSNTAGTYRRGTR